MMKARTVGAANWGHGIREIVCVV